MSVERNRLDEALRNIDAGRKEAEKARYTIAILCLEAAITQLEILSQTPP